MASRHSTDKPGAPRTICPSDKARLLIALTIASNLPPDHTPLAYILKLRDIFPLSRPIASRDRLVERIEDLERRLELARADEARAKLELDVYRAKHPAPVQSAEGASSEGSTQLGKRPGSPSAGAKKVAKKKKKVPDGSNGEKTSLEERSAQIDAAVEVIQKPFDAGMHLNSIGLVASLMRIQGTTALDLVQPTLAPLLQRCLTDVATHIRNICANPTTQPSLDSLNSIQTLLPELLLAVRSATTPNADHAAPELTRILAHDLIQPVLETFHRASVALISRTTGATRSRNRRGKLKPGARATRESEEDTGVMLVDIRPGLLKVVCMVANALGGEMVYAVLPLACRLAYELLSSTAAKATELSHRIAAPGTGGSVASARSAYRLQRLAAADSVWYLSCACHMALDHAHAGGDAIEVEVMSRCSETLVAILAQTRTNTGVASDEMVRDMLCAVLERIMLGVPAAS